MLLRKRLFILCTFSEVITFRISENLKNNSLQHIIFNFVSEPDYVFFYCGQINNLEFDVD